MPVTQAQMNVRIDAEQKRKGDSVLADFGRSPSSAVRSLWNYLARYKRLPEFMVSDDEDAAEGAPGVSKSQELAEEGAGMAIRLAQAAGLHCSSLQNMTYDELRDAAFEERMEELASRA